MLRNKYQWLDALARCDAPPPPAADEDPPEWRASYVRAVGLAITTYMEPDVGQGYCSASVANIASRAGCSSRQVRRVLDALEHYGCIVRTQDDWSRTAVIRLTPDAFDWPPEQGELELAADLEADCESTHPDCESEGGDCESEGGDCESYKDHLEDHQDHHQEDQPAGPRARELEEVFSEVGRGNVDRDDIDRIESAAESAPEGYAVHLVKLLGRKLRRARASSLAARVVEDLEARRWVCDTQWHRDRRDQAAEEARARRLAEQERQEAEQAERDAAREAVWRDISTEQRAAWREHIEREDQWVRLQTDEEARSYLVREHTIDAVLEHGADAMPPEPPPPTRETKQRVVHVDVSQQLAAMRAAITGGSE